MSMTPIAELPEDDSRRAATRVRSIIARAKEHASRGNPDEAMALARSAVQIAEGLADGHLRAEALQAVGRCHFYTGDYSAALDELRLVAQVYDDCRDVEGLTTVLAGIGTCLLRVGAHDEAVGTLMRALAQAQSHRLRSLELSVYNSLGSALTLCGRDAEAVRYLRAGIELAEAQGDRRLTAHFLLNLSRAAMNTADAEATSGSTNRADYREALGYVQQAYAAAKADDSLYEEVYCLGQKATLLRLCEEFAEAESTVALAMELAEATKEAHVKAKLTVELAQLHLATGKNASGIELLRNAIEMANHVEARDALTAAYEVLGSTLEEKGDLAEALECQKRLRALREFELASSRKHAASTMSLWLDIDLLNAVAERTGAGVIVAEGDRHVRFANSRAREALAATQVLSIVDEHVHATTPRARGSLNEALAKAVGTEPSASRLTLPRGKESAAFVFVSPLPTVRGFARGLKRLALIVIGGPSPGRLPTGQDLRDYFDLTPAESRVALLLCAGNVAKDVARELNVSVPTVRSHVRALLEKTGTTRQAELIQLLCSLPPGDSPPV